MTYLSSVTLFNAQHDLSVTRMTRYTREEPPFPIWASLVYDVLPTVWMSCHAEYLISKWIGWHTTILVLGISLVDPVTLGFSDLLGCII